LLSWTTGSRSFLSRVPEGPDFVTLLVQRERRSVLEEEKPEEEEVNESW